MKFNLPEVSTDAIPDDSLRVGNVYSARGGAKTAFWVVVSLTDKAASCLGITRDGEIVSATTYGRHVFEGNDRYAKGRAILGRVDGLEDLEFEIVWGTT